MTIFYLYGPEFAKDIIEEVIAAMHDGTRRNKVYM